MKKIAILSFVTLLFTTSLYSQDRYGENSAECLKYLSFYKESMKNGDMEAAARDWRHAISLCPPSANQTMLLDGMKILRRDINTNKNNIVRKNSLVDSLLLLHDMRIENYPTYAVTAKLNKAVDMMTYMTSGQEKMVYDAMVVAMDAAQAKTTTTIIVRSMALANDMYNAGTMTSEQVMEAFNRATNTANLVEAEAKKTNKPTTQIEKAKEDLENLLMQSGVANCENLVALFTPRYEETPNDKELLANMISMLSSSECLDENLFLRAVESLHQIEKTHASSYYLFQLNSNRNDMEKATAFLQEAIDAEDSGAEDDAKYNFELASHLFKSMGQDVAAIAAAKKSIELSDAYKARAYFLIGTIWGTQKCGGNDVEQRAPYWVAIDYLVKAKNADSTLASECDELIANYRKYYPKESDAFMFDVLDGASYTVSCNGLREVTTVRTQK